MRKTVKIARLNLKVKRKIVRKKILIMTKKLRVTMIKKRKMRKSQINILNLLMKSGLSLMKRTQVLLTNMRVNKFSSNSSRKLWEIKIRLVQIKENSESDMMLSLTK